MRVADLDLETDRGVDLSGIRFDADAEGLIDDPAVDIVVELIGGTTIARKLMLRAIRGRKHVVTANKALLADHGAEIFGAAADAGVDVGFEASVAGGIPILRSIREGLVANRIESVHGILNGTSNYVLTEMEKTGEPQEAVVKRAQDLGYAEADPSLDLDGGDAAHKLTLLASMAFGVELSGKEIPTEGIRGLAPVDFEAAREFGFRIKLLGIAKAHEGPTAPPAGGAGAPHPGAEPQPAGQRRWRDERRGRVRRRGGADPLLRGRGRRAAHRQRGGGGPGGDRPGDPPGRGGPGGPALLPAGHPAPRDAAALSEIEGRAYLRFTARDEAGVLAHITGELGEHGIGIESVIQKGAGSGSGTVPVQLVTHRAGEGALRQALQRIADREDVTEPPRLVRVEEEL